MEPHTRMWFLNQCIEIHVLGMAKKNKKTKYEQRNRQICCSGIWVTRDEQERTSNCFESVAAPGAARHFLLQNLTVQPFLWPQINNWTIGHRCLTLQGVFAFVASFPSVWWLELFVIEGLLDGRHLLFEIIFLAEPGLTTNNWKFQRLLSIWEFEPKLWKAKLRFETLVFMIGYAKPSLKRIYLFRFLCNSWTLCVLQLWKTMMRGSNLQLFWNWEVIAVSLRSWLPIFNSTR